MKPDASQEDYNQLLKENLKLKAEVQVLKGKEKVGSAIGKYAGKLGTNFLVGKGLKRSFLRLFEEIPEGRVSRVTLADVSSHIIWRMTRVGIFTLLLTVIPLLILGIQTYILNSQNQLLLYQNKRLDQQVNLQEGNRRSSLIFLMSNIMDKIGEELKDPANKKRKLTDELIGRIVSLSQALRPYRYLENDQLIAQPLSPERGQLLFSLSNSLLEINTYDKLFERADFSYSDLQNANFKGAYLEGAELQYSNLTNATFQKADLDYANFSGANLKAAKFEEASMIGIKLINASLQKSNFVNVKMTDGILDKADFTNASISGDFRRCKIDGIDLDSVTIGFLDIEGMEIHDPSMFRHLEENSSDVASIFDMSGSGRNYLNENFFWEKQYAQNESRVDSFYSLTRKKASTLSAMETCRKKVLEIIKSTDRIKEIERVAKKRKQHLLFLVEANPFGDENLGVIIDSVYRYRMTTEEAAPLSAIAWIEFNPMNQRVKEMNFEDTTFLDFNKDLLQDFPLDCR